MNEHFTDLTPQELDVLEQVSNHRLCIDIEANTEERKILRRLCLAGYVDARLCFETDCPADTLWITDKGKNTLESLNKFREVIN